MKNKINVEMFDAFWGLVDVHKKKIPHQYLGRYGDSVKVIG
jgi:hypothetical protein